MLRIPENGMKLCAAVFFICISVASCGQGDNPVKRIVSESSIAQIDFSSWQQETFRISQDCRRVAYVAEADGKQFVIVDGKARKKYGAVSAPVFSPDSKRVAYTARADGKRFIVVGGDEGKKYGTVGTPVFSPDGKRVAYTVCSFK